MPPFSKGALVRVVLKLRSTMYMYTVTTLFSFVILKGCTNVAHEVSNHGLNFFVIVVMTPTSTHSF